LSPGRWAVHGHPHAPPYDYAPYPDEGLLHRRGRRGDADAGGSFPPPGAMRHRLVTLPPPHHLLPGRSHLSSSSWIAAPSADDLRAGGRRDARDRLRALRRGAGKHVADWRDDAGGSKRYVGRGRSPGSPLLPLDDAPSPSRIHPR
jgi:hypothetical protein